MKVLVTGFDPFGGEKINPAYEAVKLLPDIISGAEIIKMEIPTVFSKCSSAVEAGIIAYQPDVIICVGQAGGRSGVEIERVGINLADAHIPDNDGEQPIDMILQEDGPAAYFSTIPVRAIVESVRNQGIPCYMSHTAGTYVCNSVMYNVLYMAATQYPNIRAGFIHVPYSNEQAAQKPNGTPGMSIETIAKALECAIQTIVNR